MDGKVPNDTSPGHLSYNEMDTHADTCCAGANWALLEYTGQVCEVSPFLSSYAPVSEIPVARCCTVWTDDRDGREYLLIGNKMLWFGTTLPHSLINPNQLRAHGLRVGDNPYVDEADFGISCDESFIPFDTTGMIVWFGPTQVPTDWEKRHLPVIVLTSDEWDPMQVEMGSPWRSREQNEMRTVRSLTSGMTTRQVSAARTLEVQIELNGEVEHELGKISDVFDSRTFCNRLVSQVNIATAYRDDVDERNASLLSAKRHSDITPEELSRKWGVGLQTAKDTLEVTTQRGVRTAVHPITRQVRVDHLNLHRPRLRGTWFVDTLKSKVKSILGNVCANVFTQGKFVKVCPMSGRAESGKSLIDFTDDVGIPEELVSDGAGEFTGKNTEFVKHQRWMQIKS